MVEYKDDRTIRLKKSLESELHARRMMTPAAAPMAMPTMAPVDRPPPPPPPPPRPGTVIPSASEVMPTLLVWMPACAQEGTAVNLLAYAHADAHVVGRGSLQAHREDASTKACGQASRAYFVWTGCLFVTEGNTVRVEWQTGSRCSF